MDRTCITCAHCTTTYDGAMGFCRKSGADIALAAFEYIGVLPICFGKGYDERIDSVEKVARDALKIINEGGAWLTARDKSLGELIKSGGQVIRDRMEALGVDV